MADIILAKNKWDQSGHNICALKNRKEDRRSVSCTMRPTKLDILSFSVNKIRPIQLFHGAI